MCREYNGWSNYETWNMNLWLTNDPSFYEVAEDAIQVIVSDDYTDTEDKPITVDKDDVTYKTAEWLKDHADNMYLDEFDSSEFNSGPVADFVHASWSQIDWYSIAEHIVNDWLENNKEEYNAILG